jgi:Ca2+-transporting ATPase
MAVVKAIHQAVSGRTRFKVEGLYRSESLKKHLEHSLSLREGVRQVSIHTLTGNVLIFYNSNQRPSDIASFVEMAVVAYRRLSPPKRGGINGNAVPAPALPTRREIPSRGKFRKAVVRSEDQESKPWHLMKAEEVMAHFGTDWATGLPEVLVKANLKKFGPNVLPESVPRSRWSILINQFKSLPVGLLWGAALISAFTGGVADALVIMSVVGINAAIGYTTESQAEKIIHSLKSLVRPSALVNRDGRIREVGAEEIVPGDLLVLRPGSYVAADARLLDARHLGVDESALTGESMPVAKSSGAIGDRNVPLADRTNMVYMGTLVTGGQGIAVVVATGRFSELGSIQTLIGQTGAPDTPMEKQLQMTGSQLVLICGAVCGVVFMVGLLRGYGFLQMIKVSISLAVAAVPEGLPAVATTTLALGLREMHRRHVLIRNLSAVETLGSIQSICLDKTGTLTWNRMSVTALQAGMRGLRVFDHRFLAGREEVDPFACEDLLKLVHISALCNESELFRKNGEYVVSGSPTENALIYLALGSGVDVLALREQFPMLKITHRSENRNLVVTLHGMVNPQNQVVAVKGSPTEVLALCRWCQKNGERHPLGEEDRQAIETANEQMAGESLRVLGVAYAWNDAPGAVSGEETAIGEGLVWLGLVGMKDPIRPRVKELIGSFHQAGINTIMITGDQTPTAFAIGNELKLSREEQLEILDSTHLSEMDPDVLKALCERVHVFSRVSPAHKLQIVYALQRLGKVVAMTGDGINDGPALKAADIGIAMGHTGTDVAREVADVILEDDHLETMIVAVSQGRTIYNNIRKTVHYLLSTNLSEIMVMFVATAGGLGQPLNAMQLLWINLVSDIFPGMALALEPPEPDVLSRPPRPPEEPIIQPGDFKRILFESSTLSAGGLGAYGYGLARYGAGPQASTLAFMSLSLGQIFHALSCRSKTRTLFNRQTGTSALQPNRLLHLAIGGTLALQGAALAVPGLRSLLGITPFGLIDGAVIGASSLWPLLVNEATKKGM